MRISTRNDKNNNEKINERGLSVLRIHYLIIVAKSNGLLFIRFYLIFFK
jgi:hypothetical protein